MLKWEDERRNSEIVGSSIKFGVFRLSVQHRLGSNSDKWFVSCHKIFDRIELTSTKLLEAKCQARAMLQIKLQDAIDQIVQTMA